MEQILEKGKLIEVLILNILNSLVFLNWVVFSSKFRQLWHKTVFYKLQFLYMNISPNLENSRTGGDINM